ncbi:MAG: diguanylate cyclase [Planctomycetota bacterium]
MKVLIVDDDIGHAELMQDRLAGEAFDVEVVLSAAECLARMGEERYDAVIVDYRMPQMSGLELLKILVDSGYGTPVVMVSGAGDERTAAEAMRRGAYDYVIKEGDLSFLSVLPGMVKRVIGRRRTEQENLRLQRDVEEKNRLLQEANAKLAKLSITDSLTELYNRRYLEEALGTEFAKSKRYRSPLSCLMCDIDHFKKVNDDHGHAVGDAVLKELGDILKRSVRRSDIVARYGGEEFVVLLSNTGVRGAKNLAEKLRKIVENARFTDRERKPELHITITIGVDTFDGENRQDGEDLLKGADEAMYDGKTGGRNSVAVSRRDPRPKRRGRRRP